MIQYHWKSRQKIGHPRFLQAIGSAAGGHGQRGSGGVVAESDNGSECAFPTEILAVHGEGFG